MKQTHSNSVSSVLLLFSITFTIRASGKIAYPSVQRDNSVVDDYHGTKVPDPYRWLEDPTSNETKLFIEEQNKLTSNYVEQCPCRNEIRDTLRTLWDYPKFTIPQKFGPRYFLMKNSGLQNQDILYVQDSLNSTPRVLFDPNTLAEDGSVTLVHDSISASKDGEIIAYALSHGGSDWLTVNFKNVSTGNDYPETLKNIKFSEIIWTLDNQGVIYGQYPPQNIQDGSDNNLSQNQKLYYHKVGTNQSDDVIVAEFPDHPKWIVGFNNRISDDGKYLILSPFEGVGNNFVFYIDLEEPIKLGFKTKPIIKPVVTTADAQYKYLASEGSTIYFLTNRNASNFKIILIDLINPEENTWKTIVPENKNKLLEWAVAVNNDMLALSYLEDVKSLLELRNLKNGSLIKSLPIMIGSVPEYSGDIKDSEFFFKFTSLTDPGKMYRVDLKNDTYEPEVFIDIAVKGFDASKYTTTQVFYSSKDGTKVPMSIVHRKNLKFNGESPLWLYGYGGFGFSLLPDFTITQIYFLQHFNGVLAVPNIRGGGEYGQNWHDGGKFFQKQNSFDDFAAAAEYLVENNYTSASKIIIHGESNGGLLIGASINQRPELFGAAIAGVGVYDMLRYQYFTTASFACSEYGCSDNKDQFNNLITFSPLHNVRMPKDEKVEYPATLLVTAAHDDRVVPLHSYKFIAELQSTIGQHDRQSNPLMLRVKSKTGHGFGIPTSVAIEEWTDVFSFIIQSIGIKFSKTTE